MYGVGALRSAARGDRLLWTLHRAVLSGGIVPMVPVGAVAEAFRTEGRVDRLEAFLDGTLVEPMDGEKARRIGELAARAGSTDLVAVSTVELASRLGCAVVSSRQTVLKPVAALLGFDLVLHPV
ncbi:MAG: hypothetical protein M0Z95_03020 [Actinomycetota bacterium]|nr:hypothetical protein [Actinomycetota bacterium]